MSQGKPNTTENQKLEYVVDGGLLTERGIHVRENQFEFARTGPWIGKRAAGKEKNEPEPARTRNRQNPICPEPRAAKPFDLQRYGQLLERADPRDVDMTLTILNDLVNKLRIPVSSPQADAGIIWRNLVACVSILRKGKFNWRDQSIPKRTAVVRYIHDKLTRKKPRSHD